MDDMNDLGSCAHGYGCNEKLRFGNDMNDLGSHELRVLDALRKTRLWLT